ncbi:transcriptional regulator, GntR family [Halanaerobium hydrogeniformans]|uniref:Transcriptional regulator, GntR family n=1 Tax=Halanaerobium hydrogeniformans TaxID=656519 RepID=E4RKF9_HALHG|nr:transcriptional regulator, GntR family [Halanaerobium hydrogeniformans]
MIAKNHLSAIYKNIAAEITQRIYKGVYPSGAYLPSENKLSQEFEVTRSTIRKALNVLKEKGTIESKQGKGYLVKELHWEQSLLQFYSFGQNIAQNIENPESKLLEHKKIKGLKSIDEFVSTELWQINRLRLMNEVPLILETSYIPIDYLKNFEIPELKQDSLYNLLKKNDNHVVRAKEYLEPVLPSLNDQELLEVKEDSCLFQTIRYSYDSENKLIELRESLIRGDHFSFSVEMTL